MRYLSLPEVLDLHRRVFEQSGGAFGIRDLGALEPAVAQPRMTFGGDDLYPTLVDKTAALGYSIIRNHALIDGNKRLAHAAMETLLVLNGHEITSPVDEAERVILGVAAGRLSRDELVQWLHDHVRPR